MGQEIVYCWKCNNRILGSEFEKGKAVQVGNHASCAACAPALLASLTPEEREALKPKSVKLLPTATPRAMPRVNSSVSIRAAPARSGPNLFVAAGVGAGVVLAIAVIVAVASGGSAPPKPAAAVKATSSEVSPKEKAVREAAAKAKAVTDVEASVRAWQEVVFASEGTSVFNEASRELKAAMARRAEAVDVEFRRLDEESRIPLRQEEFGKALGLLEAGKKRRDDSDWRMRVDKLSARIRLSAEELLPPLLEKAAEAKRKESAGELKAVEDRVAKWGLPALAEALRTSLALIPAGGVHKQDGGPDGLIVIEAENYTTNTPMNGQSWVPVREPEGLVGAAMKTTPDQAKMITKDHGKVSPRLEYQVHFVKTGRHYFWWRTYAATDADNSIHAGLDGQETPTLRDLRFGAGSWRWARYLQGTPAEPASFDIDKPGLHTLTLYMREDGAHVDRVAITTNPKWSPQGAGPAESPR